jgi:hypothetical protein
MSSVHYPSNYFPYQGLESQSLPLPTYWSQCDLDLLLSQYPRLNSPQFQSLHEEPLAQTLQELSNKVNLFIASLSKRLNGIRIEPMSAAHQLSWAIQEANEANSHIITVFREIHRRHTFCEPNRAQDIPCALALNAIAQQFTQPLKDQLLLFRDNAQRLTSLILVGPFLGDPPSRFTPTQVAPGVWCLLDRQQP